MILSVPYFRGQKRPWNSLPRINWQHPLTRGLQFYGYDAGSGPIDLVGGRNRLLQNTATTTGPKDSRFGKALAYVAAVSTGRLATISLPNKRWMDTFTATVPWTTAMGFVQTSLQGTNNTLNSFAMSDTSGTTPCVLGVASIVNTDVWVEFANGVPIQATGFTATVNTYTTLTGGTNVAGTGLVYANGFLRATLSGTTTFTPTAGTQQINFNGFGATASASQASLGGFIYYGAMWKRLLTPQDNFLLHNDPYCFLIYPEEELLAELVGASGPPPTITEDMYHQPWSTIGRKIFIRDSGTG